MQQKTNNIDLVNSKFMTLCTTTDKVLSAWKAKRDEGVRLQFPKLFGLMALELGWNESDVRENDPVVRYIVRNHPEWIISLGSSGGIWPRDEKETRDRERSEKNANRKTRKKKAIVSPEVMNEVRAEVEARTSDTETRAILSDEDEEEFGGEG